MRARVLVALIAALVAVFPAPATAESAASVATLWTAPLSGELVVARAFDPPPGPYAAGHRGVDLGGVAGSTVLAAGDGVVVFAGMVAGRPVVSIDHADGLRTTYEPVDPSVGAGQAVARGSPIGTLLGGHAGCPAGACLHWGLRRGETYLDPLLLFRPPRIRLLPWK
jgi:murein DD-endopeptidase MepM/ murein hydrolase activator NlpD